MDWHIATRFYTAHSPIWTDCCKTGEYTGGLLLSSQLCCHSFYAFVGPSIHFCCHPNSVTTVFHAFVGPSIVLKMYMLGEKHRLPNPWNALCKICINALQRQFMDCAAHVVSCMCVGDHFMSHKRRFLAATWEMLCTVEGSNHHG